MFWYTYMLKVYIRGIAVRLSCSMDMDDLHG